MLKDKVILITGSSRGIGAATARLAKHYGAEVILHGKTESEPLKKLAHELGARYIFCDVTAELEVKKEIDKFERIDVLINNAGINPSKTFVQLTAEDWKNIFDVNLMGTVNFSKAVIQGMQQRGHGKIINLASIKGLFYTPGKPAYASAKAAVMRLTTSMAEEFAQYNILVNAVAPGFTDTEMTKETLSPSIQAQISKIPLKRMGQPEEIAETILFLASDKTNYITGQIIVVDGGYTLT